MSFETLWAGWRSSYIAAISSEPETTLEPAEDLGLGDQAEDSANGCVFCRILASKAPDRERHVVWSGELSTALLNAYPYASGHLLLMPRRHVSDLEDLEPGEAADLWALVRDGVVALKRAYSPAGLNIGINLGRAAGAGVPGHLHVHALPRWVGDTSFVTAVASLRVMPESLGESWDKLAAAWPSDSSARALGGT
jgi:diadenosine tetraphosphate (Ap4A) HIT family hydrolase